MNINQKEEAKEIAVKKQRLLSIDALRGFDMFWILGGEKLFAALFIITGWSLFHFGDMQMKHSTWHGFTAYDLIFPLFIFLSGVSLGIAAKPLKDFSKEKANLVLVQGVKRLFLLIMLGVFYNHGWGGGIPVTFDDIRFTSVLGRIGISWFVAAVLVWYVSERTQWFVAIFILIAYWLMLEFFTFGNVGGGDYSQTGALNVWFDQHFLPGASYQNLAIDPEGVLSNFASIVNALCGVFIGRFMIKHGGNAKRLVALLSTIGSVFILLGYLWGIVLPINKTLWTSSFVLITVGFSTLLLTFFYLIIDVIGLKKWAIFFAVIGTNSIIIYLGTSLIDWQYFSKSIFGGVIHVATSGWDDLLLFGGMLLLQWLFLYWLYCRKIFIKV